MNNLQRTAVVLRLVQDITAKGSWSGETHIQKAGYLFQSLAGVNLGFDFVMHMHGPFSYDLRDYLHSMCAYGFLSMVPQDPYGPKLRASEVGAKVLTSLPKTIASVENQIEFVADVVGDKGVKDLERLTTALFVTKRHPELSVKGRAKELLRLKPHVLREESLSAVSQIDDLLKKASSLR